MVFYIDKYWGGWDSETYRKDLLPDQIWIIEYKGKMAVFIVLTFAEKADLTTYPDTFFVSKYGIGNPDLKIL